VALLQRKEIRNRAHALVKEWQGETREHAEAKSFWGDFFNVFGVNRRRVASFEEPVKKSGGATGFIDLLWRGRLLIEHKSKGKDLDKAYSQGLSYFEGLNDKDLPRFVMVSDFDRFRLYDMDGGDTAEFTLEELPDNIHLFDFLSGHEQEEALPIYELNIKAAERLGDLYDALLESGYEGHPLQVFLVRILFCLFAEDTGIFNRHQVTRYILKHTNEDGSDLDMHLAKLFQVLDKPYEKRNKNLPEGLAEFPYVNGALFAERFDMPSFSADMRDQLLECAYFDWADISPAIFGSLFQSVMDQETRRSLGAHYTSEKHIYRLINPLFLNDLKQEFEQITKLKRGKQQRLISFQQKLTDLQFLDPACGCGNFLITTYKAIRELELSVLQEQLKDDEHLGATLTIEPLISLDHYHGIEIEEWPARIAEVAMWLTQHQMNREFAKQFGHEPDLLPLKTAAHIFPENALTLDWAEVVAPNKLNYIIGNPPFVGKNYRSKEQNESMASTMKHIKNWKSLDFVTCWFVKSAEFMQQNQNIQAALVSTNSITMGEQVEPLWNSLLGLGIKINFSHRTFSWSSEAKGKAAVHVVIIGFSLLNKDTKKIFHYSDLNGEATISNARNINPYLIDAIDTTIGNRGKPISEVPALIYGNKPVDGGFLLLSPEEKAELVSLEPTAERWLKPVIGSREFINRLERWCLWLVGITPNELKKLPEVMKRVQQVKEMRLNSVDAGARKLAERPTEFRDTRVPETYIVVPRVSSERREYVPMGFFTGETISTDLNNLIPNAQKYHFGVLESKIHMAWLSAVTGRLKSDYRYSAKLVYNNYPWPEVDDAQKAKVKKAAQAVLDARELYPDSSLADLYDPLLMPAELRKAHNALDKVVDRCYRKEPFKDDTQRLKLLFERYAELTANS